MERAPSTLDMTPTTVWLVGLRWGVAATYAAAVALAIASDASGPIVAATISAATATTLSNVLLGRVSVLSDRIVAGALVLDVGLLTGVVALTGGASNPFAVLLIVHIALASVVSRSAWSWAVVIAAVIAYASLFFVSVDAHLWHTAVDLEIVHAPIQLHLVGMWAATAIAAIAIAALTRQLLRVLDRQRSSLIESERRLERTSHLASLTTLAAGAAHELGSPLTTVAVLARELELQAEREGRNSLREDAGMIRDEVDRCREILERMSVGVGIQLGGAGAEECSDSLPDSVNERLEAEASRVEWEGRLENLSAAALGQLTQLVLPLVRNALDACGEERITVTLAEQADRLIVEVCDHGSGMSEQVLSRSVEPFFTTKAPGRGMGLGLHLVRVVSDAMGGELVLSSTPDSGTIARLDLPRVSVGLQPRVAS